jgi:hypothetical protein
MPDVLITGALMYQLMAAEPRSSRATRSAYAVYLKLARDTIRGRLDAPPNCIAGARSER